MTTNNHPAHGPVSLDRLHQISEILSKAAAQSDGGNLGYAMADAVKVIDGAIAAFGAEPVGEVVLGEYDDCGSYPDARVVCIAADGQADWENFKDGTRLYAVNPAQVSIDERAAFNAWNNDENLPIAGVGAKNAAWLAWQARATMLQSFGNSELLKPLSHGVKLPLDYLQGHKDGLEWAAQLAEANHPQTGDWLYDDPIELARAIRKGPDMPTAQDGNSPVTPDGWIPVSERMPNDKDFVWCWGYVSGWTESDGFEAYYDATRNKWWTIDDETVRKVTHWMPLPAAPLWE